MTYLAGLLIVAVLGLVIISPSAWWSCLLFFRNYLPDESGGTFYTGHFWSLAVEEHFYLVWPGLLVLAGIPRARRMVVALAGMIAVWRVWEFRHQWLAQLIPAFSNCRWDWRTDIRLDGLLWGCWMALLLGDTVWRERLTRWLSPPVWIGLVASFVACTYYKPPLAWTWQSILIVLILAGTVLRPQTLAGSILESPPLRWVGRMSYSLYLWNSLFFPGMGYPRPLPLGILQAFPINVLNAIKMCAEVCRIYCATANPLEVVVAETQQGRGIMGVIDGSSPKGVEKDDDKTARKALLRNFGYKVK